MQYKAYCRDNVFDDFELTGDTIEELVARLKEFEGDDKENPGITSIYWIEKVEQLSVDERKEFQTKLEGLPTQFFELHKLREIGKAQLGR
jgi:hypothetical protein